MENYRRIILAGASVLIIGVFCPWHSFDALIFPHLFEKLPFSLGTHGQLTGLAYPAGWALLTTSVVLATVALTQATSPQVTAALKFLTALACGFFFLGGVMPSFTRYSFVPQPGLLLILIGCGLCLYAWRQLPRGGE